MLKVYLCKLNKLLNFFRYYEYSIRLIDEFSQTLKKKFET